MNKKKTTLFTTKIHEDYQSQNFLGSDGLEINDSYNQYLKKCSEFLAKARKNKKDNMNLKNSLLHQCKYGFENSESFEEEILLNREKWLETYTKTFNVTHFYDNPEDMYKNNKAKSKKIRLIRELDEERISPKFSENFDKQTTKWFTRYWTLSKFIQAARMIIIMNRLKKNLKILKNLSPDDLANLEDAPKAESLISEVQLPVILPCNYCPDESK